MGDENRECNHQKGPEDHECQDAYVDRGLVEGGHSALPDIDVDYASDRRQEIKEYLEERYNVGGAQRVFSAGTFSTMKLKAVVRMWHAYTGYRTAW